MFEVREQQGVHVIGNYKRRHTILTRRLRYFKDYSDISQAPVPALYLLTVCSSARSNAISYATITNDAIEGTVCSDIMNSI